MEYRKLGGSDLKVSVIGFGAWGIGGKPFWSSEGDNVSIKALKKAYDLGVTLFDTAPVYGFGLSERLVGQALKPVRDKVILATKCGLRWEQESLGAITKLASRASILEEIDQSLERLDTDYIDLYQVHWPDGKTPHAETMETLMEIQKQGKIRHIGVSNYSTQQMQECLKTGPLVSLQPEYSLLQRSIEKEAVPFCLIHDLGIIAYSPLASGVLTGKYDRNTKFKDWRSKGIIGEFTGEAFEKNIAKVEQLKAIADSHGRTCAQMAVNWLLGQPGMASALVGVKNDRQVEENLKAVGWQMDPTVQDQIDAIFAL